MTWQGQEASTGVTGSGDETPFSTVRPYEMGVRPNKALDMKESPHLTMDYLLRVECGDLKGVLMIIGAISCVTIAFFMESLLSQQKKTNTIKKSMCVKVSYL